MYTRPLRDLRSDDAKMPPPMMLFIIIIQASPALFPIPFTLQASYFLITLSPTLLSKSHRLLNLLNRPARIQSLRTSSTTIHNRMTAI